MQYFNIDEENFKISAKLIPWDSQVYGFPIAGIENFQIHGSNNKTLLEWRKFEDWLELGQCRLVSCRLPHERINESIFLEEMRFRFIEMVLHPKIDTLQYSILPDHGLSVELADGNDFDCIEQIALAAFTNERFYVDPRLPTELSHVRYARWVQNSRESTNQKVLKITEENKIVAFFVVEECVDTKSAYWHLTAVSPLYHGSGYGFRAWLSVLDFHKKRGVHKIRTTISARNTNVLNLYSKLNFRFDPPEMTFHWVCN